MIALVDASGLLYLPLLTWTALGVLWALHRHDRRTADQRQIDALARYDRKAKRG